MLISYLCTYKPHNYVNENKGFPKLKKIFLEESQSPLLYILLYILLYNFYMALLSLVQSLN